MREDSPRWAQINPSAYAHERDGLRELARYLPDEDPYHVWANVEFVGTDGSINEVDALVLTRGGLYVLELKHWHGEIRGDGVQWVRRHPGSRLIPEDNPYLLANRKAKRLASLMKFYARQQRREAEVPFVGAAVFLHARQMRVELDAIGRQHVYGRHDVPSGLASLRDALLRPPRSPNDAVDPARGRQIVELVRGAKIRPSLAGLPLIEVDVTAIMLVQLRSLGFPWEAIVAADNGVPTDVDFRSLVELMQHHVVPAVSKALAGRRDPC